MDKAKPVEHRAVKGAEVHFELLRRLQGQPESSQRELARQIGVSVGRVNYCLKALAEKGDLKVRNFRQSDRKLRYAYVITPKGIETRLRLTQQFLKRKLAEYERLRLEIEELQDEQSEAPDTGSHP